MGTISLSVPVAGQPNSTEDPKIPTALTTIGTVINGNLDAVNLSAALAQSANVNQSGQIVKGYTAVATSQLVGGASYATLATPDQVTGVVLPTGGLLAVWYIAQWTSNGGAGTAKAAIFVGGNQLVAAPAAGGAIAVQEVGNSTSNVELLTSAPLGLQGTTGASGSTTPDYTTGMAIAVGGGGGPCYIVAPAGTYTVSVKFKVSAGTSAIAARHLYVQALSFP